MLYKKNLIDDIIS